MFPLNIQSFYSWILHLGHFAFILSIVLRERLARKTDEKSILSADLETNYSKLQRQGSWRLQEIKAEFRHVPKKAEV